MGNTSCKSSQDCLIDRHSQNQSQYNNNENEEYKLSNHQSDLSTKIQISLGNTVENGNMAIRNQFDLKYLNAFDEIFDTLLLNSQRKTSTQNSSTNGVDYETFNVYLGLPQRFSLMLFQVLKVGGEYLTKQVLFNNLYNFCTLVSTTSSFWDNTTKSTISKETKNSTALPKLPCVQRSSEKDMRILDLFIASKFSTSMAPEIKTEKEAGSSQYIDLSLMREILEFIIELYIGGLSCLNEVGGGDDVQKSYRNGSSRDEIKFILQQLQNQIIFHAFYKSNGKTGIEQNRVPLAEVESWLEQNCRGGIFSPLCDFLLQKFFILPKHAMNDVGKRENASDGHVNTESAQCDIPDAVNLFGFSPKLDGHSNILSDINIWLLSLFIPWGIDGQGQKNGDLKLLYSATRDGFSMNRFENHCFKYNAPSLFLLKGRPISSNDHSDYFIIGVLLNSAWKKSKTFLGCENSIFFELYPYPEAFPVKGSMKRETNSINVQNKNTSRLILCSSENGGTISIDGYSLRSNKCRFQTDLLKGTYSFDPLSIDLSNNCLQYESPKGSNIARYRALKSKSDKANSTISDSALLSSGFDIHFMTEEIEVFGLGNSRSYLEYKRAWRFEAKEAERSANINHTLEFDPSQQQVNSFLLQFGLGGGDKSDSNR